MGAYRTTLVRDKVRPGHTAGKKEEKRAIKVDQKISTRDN